jgi:hypothetical protein
MDPGAEERGWRVGRLNMFLESSCGGPAAVPHLGVEGVERVEQVDRASACAGLTVYGRTSEFQTCPGMAHRCADGQRYRLQGCRTCEMLERRRGLPHRH